MVKEQILDLNSNGNMYYLPKDKRPYLNKNGAVARFCAGLGYY